MLKILSRDDAFAQGLKKYYTGRPCARGHDTFRYVRTGACVDCIRFYSRSYQFQIKPNETQLTIKLRNADDIPVLMELVNQLNIARELDDLIRAHNGKR